MKVVVVGGGIAGLTAAYRLKRQAAAEGLPLEVLLFEASERLGGVISTQDYRGTVVEHGPDNFITTKPAALALCRELGLKDRLIQTNDKFRRALVAFRGKLHPMPEGFVMLAPAQILPLLQSSLFSPLGKLRMLLDVVLPARVDGEDESLADFVRRRLGKEALERVAQPMMAGVYTACPEQLSLRSTMPQFLEYEAKYGSVIVGLQEEAKSRSRATNNDGGARYSMFVSLDGGIGVLVDALKNKIGESNIKLNSKVAELRRNSSLWTVKLENGAVHEADAVVVALPCPQAARLLASVNKELSCQLASIRYASSVVLNLLFRRKDIPNPLNGFGFVVPEIEKRQIIACSYSSVKFANRAPEDMVALRVFLGGALHGELCEVTEDAAVKLAAVDLRHYLGIKAAPLWQKLTRFRESMPQYDVGHRQLVEQLQQQLQQESGLYLAGNGYSGVGIPDCIASGDKAAKQALDSLRSRTEQPVA